MTETEPRNGTWLRCRGVFKHYGGVAALQNVDLDLGDSGVTAFIGPNGAGKSTLSKVLSGAVRRDAGTITLDGEKVDFTGPSAAQSRGIVMMPQEIELVPTQTVSQNIVLGSETTRWGFLRRSAERAAAADALGRLGLDLDPGTLASELSAPHQRMLMMARAVHRKARLIILDEPTAGLPEAEAAQVVAGVRRLVESGVAVVYISHHLSEVAELADRVICVRESRIVADLPKHDVTRDRLIELVLGSAPDIEERDRAEHAERSEPLLSAQLVGVSGSRIRSVDMDINTGEVIGVTGLLGSGVSELVSVVVGARQPTAGNLRIGGRDVRLRTPADALGHGVGFVPGDRSKAAFYSLSVRENVSLGALREWFGWLGLINRSQERMRVADVLEALEVTASQDLAIQGLSGGNQQRALVARPIAADVKVLVLDEPTVGVDIKARAALWGAIRGMAARRAVVVASADPQELMALCDRVLCIRHGEVAQVIERQDLTEHTITAAIA